jgi:hypothetical protein
MARPTSPKPVKYFVAILWKDESALSAACAIMKQSWGEIDYQGPDRPFDSTDYYDEEMGQGLQRRIVSFADLRSPEELAGGKLRCNDIEENLRPGLAGRSINLDIGYLDHNKVVLASGKGLGQKIYLSQGIYADLVARYREGRYQPFEWTFPDFKAGRYDEELKVIRERYLQQLRAVKIGKPMVTS